MAETSTRKRVLTNEETSAFDPWAGFLSFKHTWIFKQFINRPEKIVALYTGNQTMKTASVAYQYVMRILGTHPVEEKNMRPWKEHRIYRFASENLPTEKGENGEIKNTQYPEFKKWLPANLIIHDITIRSPKLVIKDPQGGKNIIVEFVSFSQDVQAQAGVQRASVWIDEACTKDFFEEQVPRLFTSGGDIIMTLTPALNFKGWEYEDIYERARTIIRTKSVRDRMKLRYDETLPSVQTTESKDDICVISAATDDNPVYKTLVSDINARLGTDYTVETYLDEQYAMIADEDIVDVRRFGLFKQVSGRIHKNFDTRIHCIDINRYFIDGQLPSEWRYARLIDYHPVVPWACMWVALSPHNECFVWNDWNPNPGKNVIYDIALQLAILSRKYKYDLDLIDPLAGQKQTNTNLSPIDDMNRIFHELRREDIGTGAYWRPWDTKSQRGREEVKTRLSNSLKAGVPFNNKIERYGKTEYLPTLWISNQCRSTILSMKNWRTEMWVDQARKTEKEEKETPIQRWSHFNMCLEAVFKDPGFRPKPLIKAITPRQPEYFQGKSAGALR